MNHPAYQLRANKAIDRVLLVEAIRALSGWLPMKKMRYYGLGGPFLDDFRLLCDAFPAMKMVSIESNEQTHRRQQFHKVSKQIALINDPVHRFLDGAFPQGAPCIFWLDYTTLGPDRIGEFERLLGLVGEQSVVKITLRAQIDDQLEHPLDPTEFASQYRRWLKDDISAAELRSAEMPALVEGMLQMASQRALNVWSDRVFHLIQSCYYSDGTQMLSVTGLVCKTADCSEVDERIAGIEAQATAWGKPERIDIPVLSVKERLHMERHLPIMASSSARLIHSLGYRIGDSVEQSKRRLDQYRKFHRYYPLFAKISV